MEEAGGAAFVYLGGASGIADGNPATAAAQLESDQFDGRLGYAVAAAGDVNGDGYADVIVGAPYYDAGQPDEGVAFVFHGSAVGIANGDPATAAAQLESNQSLAHLGWSVSGAGDVNGDGYADVIVGAPYFGAGEPSEGTAFVFLGSATGIADGNPATAATQLESNQMDARLGFSVSGAGDANGDGFADVIVGAPYYGAGQLNEGAAFIFLGSAVGVANGNPATTAAQLESNQPSARLGYSVAGAGDLNGDGYADVIVGAPYFTASQASGGAAFVFLGNAAGIADGNPATAAAQLESDLANALLGWSVAGAGDVNSDGYADVIVGAPWYEEGETKEGAAFVYLGSAAGIADGSSASAAAQLESDWMDGVLGVYVAGAGDVNGDGYADIIVGAPNYEPGLANEGAAFVFLGSATGIADGSPATAAAQLESNQMDSGMGWSVSGAGDVNGDGTADVIVGAKGYDAGQVDEGAAFVFLGNSGNTGRPVLARQLRGGDSTPVQPWGTSESPDSYQVQMQATHPDGRGRVKLEVENCGPGVPFGDPSCTQHLSPSWTDAGLSGVTLTETIPIPFGATLARWRARVLYAPFRVTEAGITPPPNPAHGPWRRLSGQAVEADVRRQLSDNAAVLGGMNVSETLLSGPPAWGGVQIVFDDTSGGTLTGSFSPLPLGPSIAQLLANPGSINFYLPSNPLQFWSISYSGSFNGVATITFQYDDSIVFGSESLLGIAHYEGGAWVQLPVVARDLVNNTITVTTTSFSPFLLAGALLTSIGCEFSGTAAGGSIDFTIGGVFLSVTTTAAQTADQVAAAVAAAINGDSTLATAGISATATGGSVTSNGAFTSIILNDSGLTHAPVYPPPIPVPALGGAGALALGLLLLAAAWWALRRRHAGT